MEEERTCEECKKIFPLDKSKRGYWKIKYCSDYCQGRARRKRCKVLMKRLQKEWELKNYERRRAYQREWERKNREKRYIKTKKWLAKNPYYHRDYHKRPKAREREKRYAKIPRVRYKHYIRGLTSRKFGKLEKGLCYHHTTNPYEFDKFVILEKGLHDWMHKYPKSFVLGGLNKV